jgi:hypothetical protein
MRYTTQGSVATEERMRTMATTVRVEETLAEQLREIASEEHRPIGQVIADAIAQYQREKFWKGVHEDFVRLRSDPVAWQEYQDEIVLFEGASMDGLEEEPPYYTPEEEEAIRAEHARTQHGGGLGR